MNTGKQTINVDDTMTAMWNAVADVATVEVVQAAIAAERPAWEVTELIEKSVRAAVPFAQIGALGVLVKDLAARKDAAVEFGDMKVAAQWTAAKHLALDMATEIRKRI